MLTLTHILCPTDFSDVSRKAEAYAAALATHYDAELRLLHVESPMPVVGPYGEVPLDPRFFDTQHDLARQDLNEALARAQAAGVAAEGDLIGGQAGREILEAAKAQPADLVVLGTHGRGGFEHLLLGSVAERVLRKAECPVMVVPPDAAPERGVEFRRILCPIDGSPASHDAVAFAVSLARETDGEVTLLQVVEPIPPAGEFGALATDEYMRLGEAHARESLAQAVSEDVREWCRVREVVAFGKASQCILDTARESAADVIVMGVRGRGAIDLAAFGSTTNEVARRARCPVVAVHPQAVERLRTVPVPLASTVV